MMKIEKKCFTSIKRSELILSHGSFPIIKIHIIEEFKGRHLYSDKN